MRVKERPPSCFLVCEECDSAAIETSIGAAVTTSGTAFSMFGIPANKGLTEFARLRVTDGGGIIIKGVHSQLAGVCPARLTGDARSEKRRPRVVNHRRAGSQRLRPHLRPPCSHVSVRSGVCVHPV